MWRLNFEFLVEFLLLQFLISFCIFYCKWISVFGAFGNWKSSNNRNSWESKESCKSNKLFFFLSVFQLIMKFNQLLDPANRALFEWA